VPFSGVSDGTYLIGRKAPIRIVDQTVSAHHAELVVLGNRLYLADLGSTNGTFLLQHGRQKPFKEGYVTPEQIFIFGQYVCRIQDLIRKASTIIH
jgi:pSer/pThr/pTyr-binding forkhead associated (FHA) protein